MAMTKRQLQKEQTKKQLIDTAYDVFSRRGIMETRMSDIAESAGLSHGSVFLHFNTQEALIEEVVSVYTQKLAQRTHELAENSGDFEALLRAHLKGIMEFESFYTRLVIENRRLPPGARDSWIAAQSAISFHFGLVYDRCGKDIKPDIPLFMLFNTWMGLVHYYLSNSDLFAPEGSVLERYGEVLITNFMKLLKGDCREREDG